MCAWEVLGRLRCPHTRQSNQAAKDSSVDQSFLISLTHSLSQILLLWRFKLHLKLSSHIFILLILFILLKSLIYLNNFCILPNIELFYRWHLNQVFFLLVEQLCMGFLLLLCGFVLLGFLFLSFLLFDDLLDFFIFNYFVGEFLFYFHLVQHVNQVFLRFWQVHVGYEPLQSFWCNVFKFVVSLLALGRLWSILLFS